MSWYNPLTWFSDVKQGAFIHVSLDYGFLSASHERNNILPAFFVSDATLGECESISESRKIDWHSIPVKIRRGLETGSGVVEIDSESLFKITYRLPNLTE